jgi:uncharacterized phage protein (TIGR01671 family)
MRNIEFRATRKDTRETFGVLSLDWIHGSVLLDGHMIEVEMDSVIIQQFTGLLDKNGVKIFEGDKVKAKPRGSKKYGIFNVIYDKSYCSFVCHHVEWVDFTIDPHENYPLGECRFDIEVIGNIHEVQNV